MLRCALGLLLVPRIPEPLRPNAPVERRLQSVLGCQAKCRILIPQRNDHVSVDTCRHSLRIPRSHFSMLVRPLAIPGLPIPRYLENALLVRTGRTRTPFPSLSNSNLSPRPHPQYAAHFTRHSDLTFASDSCLLLHIHPAIPYFLTLSLLRAFDAYEALRGGYEAVCPPRGAARTASGRLDFPQHPRVRQRGACRVL